MIKAPDTAMLLAAGLGKRMRPHNNDLPKPLVAVAGKALIDYALDRFAAAGVKRAVVNVHFQADRIEAHLSARKTPQIVISDERGLLLETGGGLKKAQQDLGHAPIFCTNTDSILIDAPGGEACARLASGWDASRMDALLLLSRLSESSGFDGAGDFDLHTDGRISFRKGEIAAFAYTGLQILHPKLLDGAPSGAFSMRILWDEALAAGRLHGLVHQGFWMHVGDPDGFRAAETRLRAAI